MDSKRSYERDVFGGMYAGDLEEAAQDSRLYCAMLGEDWVSYQQTSGLLVPRYLTGLAEEVDRRLFAIGRTVSEAGSWVVPIFDTGKTDDGQLTDHLQHIRNMYSAPRFQTAKRLYSETAYSAMGMADVAFAMRVFNEASIRGNNGKVPEALDIISENISDETIVQGFRTGMDRHVYKSARYKRNLDDMLATTLFASSPEARLAMRAALDLKVLNTALKTKDSKYADAGEIISEFASTSSAREAMLGHVAMRASGTDARSFYGAAYSNRITRDLAAERAAQKREQEREKHRTHWQQEQERHRSHRDSYYANWQARTGARTAPSRERNTVDAILLRAPQQSYRTLRACGASEIERVVGEVQALRVATPDISAREVYLHFHARTQSTNPSENDLNTTKILGLMLNGNFSKEAVLPF